MIGDPLHDFLKTRSDARDKKFRRLPAKNVPEGVAFYGCRGLVPIEEPASEYDESVRHKVGCGATAEAKPYAPKPRCHGRDMAITGYDWERDART